MDAGPDSIVCEHIYTMQAKSRSAEPVNGLFFGFGIQYRPNNPNTIVSGLSYGKNVY